MLNYQEYIYAIYQEKSFSKASKKLFVSQPWLSSVVKRVEQEIKNPIFDRTTSPISLTEAGRYYIEQVEKVMEIENDMRQHFAQMNSQSGTSLHIGSSTFFCTYVLPRLMKEFKEFYPHITLRSQREIMKRFWKSFWTGKLTFFWKRNASSILRSRSKPGLPRRSFWLFPQNMP